MQFYSTQNRNNKVTLEQAVVRGLADDNGLYMPERIDRLPDSFFKNLRSSSYQSIAYDVARNFISEEEVPKEALSKIIERVVSFDVPLVPVEEAIWSLELFHGSTLAFKDFGAQFMASLLGYFVRNQSKEVTILVATSGDTGSAVANGFHNVPGTKVVVLYPSGKVSDVQEKQFTTLGGNVIALEVNGTFDDCQRLVKTAFLDSELRANVHMTSANSINIARLIPQSFYYFFAVAQLPANARPNVFSVPSGNFGNLTGGVLAMKMGLPITHFVAATNVNDVVPEYLHGNKFLPRPSIQTISNAMDVGNPSNFVRLMDLFNGDFKAITSVLKGFAFTDEETQVALKEVKDKFNYTLDPHGAVAYLGLKKYQQTYPESNGVFLETAHPGKFRSVVEEALGTTLELPARLQEFVTKEKQATSMSNQFEDFKSYLLSR